MGLALVQEKPGRCRPDCYRSTLLVAGTVISSYFALAANQEAEQRRRALYVSDMHLAGRAWDANDLQTVERLLDRYRSQNPDADLRGFEWYYLWRLWWRNRLLSNNKLSEHAYHIAVCPEGRYLAAARPHGDMVTLWDIPSGKKVREFGTATDDLLYSGKTFVAFAPIGKTVAYPTRSGTQLISHDLETEKQTILQLQEGAKVTAAVYSPQPGILLTSSDDGQVRAWDTATRSVIQTFDKHRTALQCIAHEDGRAAFWQFEGSQVVNTQGIVTSAAHHGIVLCMAFNGDGSALVTGGRDRTVVVWDPRTGEPRGNLGPTSAPVTSVAFSADGNTIAAGSYIFLRGEIILWDWPSGQLIQSPQGHRLTVWSLAFLKDQRTLISVGGDRALKVWDLPTGLERFNLEGFASIFHSLAISSDEKLIAAGARDGTIRLYRAATDDEVTAADW